ncbi:hypothetical protein [Microlunatus sp. Y2014]|uniref:hypothetical protein n=1 Tax=Microlunatus sp. Y2014 TaxID=3418488 RepID=UPI003DA78F38
MTWCKLGTEFYDQLAAANFPDHLDDACMNTHTQAIHYLYSVEGMTMRFKKRLLTRFATSSKADEAALVLVQTGTWADRGTEYEVVHHADVVRQSIAAQKIKRERDKNDKRKKRSSGPVGSDVGSDTDSDVVATQTDRQTDRQRPHEAEEQAEFDEQTGELLSESSVDPRQPPSNASPSENPSHRPPIAPLSGADSPPTRPDDPWADQPSTYPTCSAAGCSQVLRSPYLRNAGVCTNHIQVKSKEVA